LNRRGAKLREDVVTVTLRRSIVRLRASEKELPEPPRDLTTATPEEALSLYLRERSTDVTESTLQAHEYRLNHFVRRCNSEGETQNLNNLSGRDLHHYKPWRTEDGDLNQVSLKSQPCGCLYASARRWMR